jgi:hypothetical protein
VRHVVASVVEAPPPVRVAPEPQPSIKAPVPVDPNGYRPVSSAWIGVSALMRRMRGERRAQ